MSLKEHLQFLAMMIPSFLLLSAAALTLAFPTRTLGEPTAPVALVQDTGFEPSDPIDVQ